MSAAEIDLIPAATLLRRRTGVRATSVNPARISKRALARDAERANEALAGIDATRPTTRAECEPGGANEMRPCPFVSCKYHLYLDVRPTNGSLKLNFPALEVWEIAETCALDAADRGGMTLEETGDVMNLTRERARQIETQAIGTMRAGDLALLSELAGVADADGGAPEPIEGQDRASFDEDVAAFARVSVGPRESTWWQTLPGGKL